MALVQLQWPGVPGATATRLLLPPGCGRRVYVQASTGVTGVDIAFLPSGLTSGFPSLVQTFTPALGLSQAQTAGLALADDRVFATVAFQGGPGSQVALVVDDGRPCCT